MTTSAIARVSGLNRPCRHAAGLVARLALSAAVVAPMTASVPVRAADRPAPASARGNGSAPANANKRIVDPAVVPAGAMPCQACGPACGGHGGRHGHHAGCRDGHCVPYCPVRPDRYGYYGTQWRRWPGQQIAQVSNNQDASPASPPRSEVPGADEESMNPRADDLPAPTTQPAAPLTPAAPDLLPSRPAQPQPTPDLRQPDPAMQLEPEEPAAAPEAAPAPAPATVPEPAPTPTPEAAPTPEPAAKPDAAPAPKPRPQDENLFEAKSGWRAKRKFAIARPESGVTQAGHATTLDPRTVDPRNVPRVPFDASTETRNVRAAGGR